MELTRKRQVSPSGGTKSDIAVKFINEKLKKKLNEKLKYTADCSDSFMERNMLGDLEEATGINFVDDLAAVEVISQPERLKLDASEIMITNEKIYCKFP